MPEKLSKLTEAGKCALVIEVAQTSYRQVAQKTGYSRGSLFTLVTSHRDLYNQTKAAKPATSPQEMPPQIIAVDFRPSPAVPAPAELPPPESNVSLAQTSQTSTN